MSQKHCYVKDLKPGMKVRFGDGLTGVIHSIAKVDEKSTVNQLLIDTGDGRLEPLVLFDHVTVQVLK